jgi:hypothetical protein
MRRGLFDSSITRVPLDHEERAAVRPEVIRDGLPGEMGLLERAEKTSSYAELGTSKGRTRPLPSVALMSRITGAVGALSTRLRWFAAFLTLSLVMSVLAPAPAAAVTVLADFTLGAPTVNPQTGLGHVTVSVTCLVPAASVRTRLATIQTEGQGRHAFSSSAGGVLTGCQAGQRVSMVVAFVNMSFGEKFAPGWATMTGFVELFPTTFIDFPEAIRFGPLNVLIRPER